MSLAVQSASWLVMVCPCSFCTGSVMCGLMCWLMGGSRDHLGLHGKGEGIQLVVGGQGRTQSRSPPFLAWLRMLRADGQEAGDQRAGIGPARRGGRGKGGEIGGRVDVTGKGVRQH